MGPAAGAGKREQIVESKACVNPANTPKVPDNR
jgi:hypothetical protein